MNEEQNTGLTYHGSACPKGHTERYVLRHRCVQCASDYKIKYRASNRRTIQSRLDLSTASLKHIRMSASTAKVCDAVRDKYRSALDRPVSMTLVVCRALKLLDEELTKLSSVDAWQTERKTLLADAVAP